MFKHLEKVAGFVIDSGSSFKSNALTISAMYVQRCHIYAQVVNYLNASPKYGFYSQGIHTKYYWVTTHLLCFATNLVAITISCSI